MKAGHFSAKIPGQFSAAINNLGGIATNDAGLLKLLYTPCAGRWRQSNPLGQHHLTDAGIAYQLTHDLLIDFVDIGGHGDNPGLI